MADTKQQVKSLGLRFARALQMTVKTTVMFTVEHKSVERPIQQSFLLLNNLLKGVGQFTFGFIDNQVMLNNLLTVDSSLKQLETEFLKRGIAAVTFEPGLTLARYKKVINLLAAPTKSIEASGGLLSFLDQNEIEGARILPAAKNQKKDEHGDTIIETDSEAYILSKQMSEEQTGRDFLDSIDSLLESGCFDPSTRTEVLSEFATRGMDGYGVPLEMQKLVVLREGESIAPGSSASGLPSGGGSTSTSSATGGPGSSEGDQARTDSRLVGRALATTTGPFAAAAARAPGYPGGGSVAYPAQTSSPFDQTSGFGGPASGPTGRWTGSSGSFMEMVEASVQRSLLEEKGNPQKSYMSLARILRNMGVDKVLEHFPAERREALTSLPPEQLAAEYIEDTALQIAGAKLKSAGGHSQKFVIEEEVVRVLARSLQATQMAERLAQKLTKFIQDFAVPPHIQEKIREELHWSSLNIAKKCTRLMELNHYSPIEFRRLMDVLKELVTQREIDRANTLASHYFDFLDNAGSQIDAAELGRVPELIRSIPLAQVGFASKTVQRLGRALFREDLSEFVHVQAASALTVLSQSIAAFEDFQNVLAIGVSLENSLNRNPEAHKKCCATGLSRLLPAAAVDRIIELFLQQRGDSAWTKTAATLLRFAAPGSIERVFDHLIREQDARNRLALVRLVGQLGSNSVEVAYKYLTDERWYVVRNICGVLAELKDPELADHITPALQHPDARVQQAALKALVRSRTVRAAPVLAASLSKFAPNLLDEALDELMFLRHVKTISGLEQFVLSGPGSAAASKKAIQVLANIDDDEALHALARLFRTEGLDNHLRRSALTAICKNPSAVAVRLLQELASIRDPFADEARAELRLRSSS